MLLSPFAVAASALFAVTAVAAPMNMPPSKVPNVATTTVFFSPGTSQELVEHAGRVAPEQGAQVIGYFGLPPNGHDLGFTAHLSNDAITTIIKTVGNEAALAFDTEGSLTGNFCPEVICHF